MRHFDTTTARTVTGLHLGFGVGCCSDILFTRADDRERLFEGNTAWGSFEITSDLETGKFFFPSFYVERLVYYAWYNGHHENHRSYPNQASDMRHLPSNKPLQPAPMNRKQGVVGEARRGWIFELQDSNRWSYITY